MSLPHIQEDTLLAVIEKATRVAKYAAEYAERGEFDYDVDPDMQYKNEHSLCNGLIRGGILDAADFMEQDVRITNCTFYTMDTGR